MSTTDSSFPTAADFERQLTHFINVTLLSGSANVGRDTRLFEDGYVNSLRILDLIAFVENTLGRKIPDRAVRLANFRTIATIVSAFHPDGSTMAVPPSDRLFEHRTDRSRFASPIDALMQRGDLRTTSAGQAALSGLALAVYAAVDRTVLDWARSLGAAERRYPSLIDVAALQRAGRVESLSTVIPSEGPKGPGAHRRRAGGIAGVPTEGLLYRDDGDSSTSLGMTAVLSPAVCYHAYPEWEGKTLGLAPELLTAVGSCYRYEGGNHVPLERLWDFTMREIIILGTRDQVEDVRQSLVRQVSDLVARLDLDATIEPATDPFFTTGDEGRRLMQQAGALKYELLLTVDTNGRAIAAASFNHHHDYFGTRFGIKLPGGATAHSGCVAFGLERWVLGLLAQHGVNEDEWCAGMRAWFADVERAPRSQGTQRTDGAGA